MRINMVVRACSLIFVLTLSCCAPIKHTMKIDQKMDEVLTMGIGDTVFSSRTEKNLPNIFGRADIYGRTTPTEITEVIYAGNEEGKAVFLRKTFGIETGATTMNSSVPLQNAPRAIENILSEKTHKISLDIEKVPASFVVLGTTITVLEVKDHSVNVILKK